MQDNYLYQVKDILNIDLTGNKDKIANLDIYDYIGKVVYSEKINIQKLVEIDLGHLQPGIYKVKVETANFVYNKKFKILISQKNNGSINYNDMYLILFLLITYSIFFLFK